MSIREISRAVSLTEAPVSTRIRKLEESGIISHYIAVLNREKTELPVLVMLLVRLTSASGKLSRAFEKQLAPLSEIEHCYVSSGSWNYVLHVAAASPQQYGAWLFEHILSLNYIAGAESIYLMREVRSAEAEKPVRAYMRKC